MFESYWIRSAINQHTNWWNWNSKYTNVDIKLIWLHSHLLLFTFPTVNFCRQVDKTLQTYNTIHQHATINVVMNTHHNMNNKVRRQIPYNFPEITIIDDTMKRSNGRLIYMIKTQVKWHYITLLQKRILLTCW